MMDFVQDNWIAVLVGVVLLLILLWVIVLATRRTSVDLAARPADEPARRNQALIDAPAAAPPAATIPPFVPGGVGGVGEAVAASAAQAPVTGNAATADDLARIKGVGPKLMQQLNAMGVTELSQIAAWSDADIDRIDAQLGRFQGRIRRDDWPTQARLLMTGDTAGYEAKFGKL